MMRLAFVTSFAATAMLLPGQVPTYTIRTVAGRTTPGDGGFAANAVLGGPLGKVATDTAGNVYFTDSSSNGVFTMVRRVAPDGLLTTVAGGGSGTTPAEQALIGAYAVTVDNSNNLYFGGSFQGCTVQRVNLTTGAITALAGTGACNASGPDGPGASTALDQITGLALDSNGGLLISERYGYRVRRLDLTTLNLTTIVGTGKTGAGADGLPATQTALSYTEDVAIDSKGDIFVLDAGNCVVREIAAATNVAHIVAGQLGKCGFAGEGVAPTSAQFDASTFALTVTAAGDVLYVGEGGGDPSSRVRKVDLGHNLITTYAGGGGFGDSGDGGPATQALVAWVDGLALTSNGGLLISEYAGGRVRLIDSSQNIHAFAGLANPPLGDGGPALAALMGPTLTGVDGKGGLVFSDGGNRRIRGVSNGIVSTIAGSGDQGSTGDGGPATSAGLFVVYGMAVDPAGPIYISEGSGEVRVITGNIIKAASTTKFNFPMGLALDPSHRYLYISEFSGDRVVRLDTNTGQLTTIAGLGTAGANGSTGDDGDNLVATQAHLNGPSSLAVDAAGNVYVLDTNSYVIRKINPTANTMVTVAGNHKAPTAAPPDGSVATSVPTGSSFFSFTVDSGGNIFYVDGAQIRRVDAGTHTLATVAGTGTAGFSGDGGPALSAELNGPTGLSMDSQGNVYFGDNSRIRALSAPATAPRIDAPIVAAAFGGGFNITPGTWMEIYGEKLSPTSREWAGSDFNGNQAPSSLDNVKVLINGTPAYIDIVSPGQVNAQVPDGIGTGNVSVQVVSPDGTSDPVIVSASVRSPVLLAPPSFSANEKQYVTAVLADGSYAGPPNLIPGAPFRAAQIGETALLYGIGFGSGTPLVPAGLIDTQSTALPNVTVTIGGVSATVSYAGLVSGYVGLYQFNVVVPSGVSGDAILAMSVDGVPVQQVLYLTTP